MGLFHVGKQRNPDHEAMNRKILRKLDWNTLPALSLLWLACFSEGSEFNFFASRILSPTEMSSH